MDHDRVLDVSYPTDYSLDSPSTLVTSETKYEPSEATTLYEGEGDLYDTSSSTVYVVKSGAGNARRDTYTFNERWSVNTVRVKSEGKWQWGDDQYPNRESAPPTTTSSRSLRKILSGLIGLFTDYKTRKRLSAIDSRVERYRRNYHPLSVKELQTAYEYLHELERRRKKFASAALTLRLSVLELLFDILDNPVIFSEGRRDLFHKLWLDLDYESSYVVLVKLSGTGSLKSAAIAEHDRRVDLKVGTHKQISDLKHTFFLRVVNELPVNRSISEIIPDGPSAVKALCKELAYGSGVYSIQRVLRQIARTEWGHRELLRLSPQSCSKTAKDESNLKTNLIIDCITKLLSFKNGFSHAMAFRIFGRVAEYNHEVHTLLAGPMGVIWLVDRLDEQPYTRTSAYRSFRQVETYCHALMAACTKGFINCVLECDIVSTLLYWVEIFTIRDEAMYSMIEDNQQDDSDVELDQIACCELIILLMTTPSGKKQFLDGSYVLRTFMSHPNRSFSDWKLSVKLTTIVKLLES